MRLHLTSARLNVYLRSQPFLFGTYFWYAKDSLGTSQTGVFFNLLMQNYCAHAAIRKYLLVIIIFSPFGSRLFVNIQSKWNISPDSSGAATALILLWPRSTNEILAALPTHWQAVSCNLPLPKQNIEQQTLLHFCICNSGDYLVCIPTYCSIRFT